MSPVPQQTIKVKLDRCIVRELERLAKTSNTTVENIVRAALNEGAIAAACRRVVTGESP